MLQHPTCFPSRNKQLHLSDVSGHEETSDCYNFVYVPGLCSPNGPDSYISTQGSFIYPLLTGHFVGCKSRAAGATALFSLFFYLPVQGWFLDQTAL